MKPPGNDRPRTGYVLDIFNPRIHLGEALAPKVALLKAIFGIDDTGRLTRPPPPKAFSQQVFEYIMFGRVYEQTLIGGDPDIADLTTHRKKLAAALTREIAARAAELKRHGVRNPVTQAEKEIAKRLRRTGPALNRWLRRHR